MNKARQRRMQKAVENVDDFLPDFATTRRVSFNMHPWLYVKFM
jgi:hypothetical protein